MPMILLLAQGLKKKIMNICSDFETNHFITFNTKKTLCIQYGQSVKLIEHVMMNGNLLSWRPEAKHLGNFCNGCLVTDMDINRKCSHFIGYYNQMVRELKSCRVVYLCIYLFISWFNSKEI